MNISRPTFQRVLLSARRKIAYALLNGKAIRIEGGSFEVAQCRFRCCSGHEWDLETSTGKPPEFCPTCSTPDIEPVHTVGSGYGRNRGKHHGRMSATNATEVRIPDEDTR